MHSNFTRRSKARNLVLAAFLAMNVSAAMAQTANLVDPFETFNRSIFGFNEGIDRAVFKPVAKAYRAVLPSPVRTGVNNFFSNVGDVWSLANNAMQLKAQNSAETFMRLNVNTVFGLGGLLDVATELGIQRHREDFGQTLGYWGVPSGPYLVLPLLGPSTLRDTAALPVDRYGDLVSGLGDIPVRNSLYTVRVVDERATYLRAGELIDEAALDKYSFMRDAFLQKRLSEVKNGEDSSIDSDAPSGVKTNTEGE